MVVDKGSEGSMKKANIGHLVNWFWGNYCAKCGKVDLDDFGDECRRKIERMAREIGVEEIRYKDFVLIMRRSLFCKPFSRKFCECRTCRKFGLSDRYLVKD